MIDPLSSRGINSIPADTPQQLIRLQQAESDVKQLKAQVTTLRMTATAPVTDTVPTAAGLPGEIRLYANGSTFRLYAYVGGAWRSSVMS